MDSSSSRKKAPAWFAATKAFEAPSRWRATLQLIDTLGPFLTIGVAAAFLSRAGVPWYVLSALAIFGGLFMVRLFILFHDCCHGSFWAGRKAHGTHHAHNGNLDQRGVGDVWTLTLEEYRRASPGRRFQYRLYRNPVFLFLFSPPLLFLLLQRLPDKGASRSELCGVHVTTVAVLAMLGSVGWLAGREFLLAYALPMTYVATGGFGYSTCSTSLIRGTGSTRIAGTPTRRPSTGLRSTVCRRGPSGSRGTSAFTTSTIYGPTFRTTGFKRV